MGGQDNHSILQSLLRETFEVVEGSAKKITNKNQAASKMSPTSSGSLSDPEGGGSMFLQNIGKVLLVYVTSQTIIFFAVIAVRTSNLT
jgi:hypothetical protein